MTKLAIRPSVNPNFWIEVERRKLHEYRLQETPIRIFPYYNIMSSEVLPHVHFDEDCFNAERAFPPLGIGLSGFLVVYNSYVNMRDRINQDKMIAETELLKNMESSDFNHTSSCVPIIFCYSDPKKHTIKFLFYAPVLNLCDNALKLIMFQTKKYAQCFPKIPKKDFFLTISKSELKTQYKNTILFADPVGNDSSVWYPLLNLAAFYLYVKDWKFLQVVAYRRGESVQLDTVYEFRRLKSSTISELGWVKESWSESEFEAAVAPVDLSPLLDKETIIKNSFSLNLNLMKWQLFPGLDLEKHMQLRCLLIGAGTLGCNIARNLLAWGITNITFIDDGTVSFSNPPRQSLYIVEDCSSSMFKAKVAAEALKKIYPGVNSRGSCLRIPEPGHPLSAEEKQNLPYQLSMINNELDNHDVVFLLTDTRESRWLPTALCVMKGKLVICAAIAADSFLVMRHSFPCSDQVKNIENHVSSDHLGCYFCSDVVCPTDTVSKATMDMKCSVTRPGMSMMAAAHAVELLVSLLHHPNGFAACAPLTYGEENDQLTSSGPLGLVPHQLRYFQSTYNQLISTVTKFSQCMACSPRVIKRLEHGDPDFLIDVCENPDLLSTITGIDDMLKAIKQELETFEI